MFKISGQYTVVRDYIEVQEELGNHDVLDLFGKKINFEVSLANSGMFYKGVAVVDGKTFPVVGKKMDANALDFQLYFANEKGEIYSFSYCDSTDNDKYNSIVYYLLWDKESKSHLYNVSFFANAQLEESNQISDSQLIKEHCSQMTKVSNKFENFLTDIFNTENYYYMEDFLAFEEDLTLGTIETEISSEYIPFYDICGDIEDKIEEYVSKNATFDGENVEIDKQTYLKIANEVLDYYSQDQISLNLASRSNLLDKYYEILTKNDSDNIFDVEFKTELVPLHVAELLMNDKIFEQQSTESVDMLLTYALYEKTDNEKQIEELMDVFKQAYNLDDEEEYIVSMLQIGDSFHNDFEENMGEYLCIYAYMKKWFNSIKQLTDASSDGNPYTFDKFCKEIKDQTIGCFELKERRNSILSHAKNDKQDAKDEEEVEPNQNFVM